jgi:hypothetical protein
VLREASGNKREEACLGWGEDEKDSQSDSEDETSEAEDQLEQAHGSLGHSVHREGYIGESICSDH